MQKKIELLSKALSPQDVQLYYQIALKGREDLTLSPNGRVGLEMIVLRMMAFRPSSNSGANVVSSNCEPASVPVQSASQSKTAPARTVAAPRAQQPSPAQSSPQVAPQPSSNSQPEYHASGYETVPPQYDMAPPMSENPAPQHETPPQQMQESVSTPARGGLSGLRHQLRSQRQGLQQNTPQNGGSKKSKAASAQPESVIDRVAQLHGNSAQVSPNLAPKSTEPQVEEAYRWRPSKPVETKVNTKLTPTQLKQALEHEKTPEMAQKLIDESLEHNEWAKLISLMEIPKLVEQLALNSHYSKEGTTVSLLLRSSQAHLNTDRAQAELLKALNTVLGEECHMSIEIGESGETPLELRDRLYQEKLQQALNSLENDPNVQFIERRFAAELDKDSVRPI